VTTRDNLRRRGIIISDTLCTICRLKRWIS